MNWLNVCRDFFPYLAAKKFKVYAHVREKEKFRNAIIRRIFV